MIDLRPVLFVAGMLLSAMAAFMFLPALVDLAAGSPDWRVFLASAFFTLFVGVTLMLMNNTGSVRLTVRQTFVLTTFAWVAMAAFAALPFSFAKLELDYADAFFESMSGLTTTGATVIVGLDDAPPGILLWRALLQWQGGIGIIVMAIAVLPMLNVAGMQLFRTESSETAEKVLPRAAQMSAAIGVIYVVLTAAAAVSYWLVGMTPFEAVTHAMTTIPTGGYSTYDASIGHFRDDLTEWVVSFFMLVSGLPFILYFQLLRGHGGELWRDTQVRTYFGIAAVGIVTIAGYIWLVHDFPHMDALRHAVFNTVSVMTGTGYASTDYGAWGPYAVTALLFVMMFGGCTGSTTGGIKIFRLQIVFISLWVQLRRLLQPHGVFTVRFNRKPVPDPVVDAVVNFMFLFVAGFAVIALALALHGLDFMTSVSGAATTLANVGPGLGRLIGPTGTFASLPDSAKWVLSAAMLLGRLEFLTVLVLFTRRFWRG